jgi:hypothetical protein
MVSAVYPQKGIDLRTRMIGGTRELDDTYHRHSMTQCSMLG